MTILAPDPRLGQETASARAKADFSVPEWVRWRTRSRPARCIRFIESYCRIPTGFGAGEPMRLERFQREVLEELLEGSATVSAWQVCKGNTKSTLIAAMGLWALCDFADAPQVPLIAQDGKQVERTLFRPLQLMVRASPALQFPRLKIYTAAGDKRIHSWWNSGDLMPLPASADSLQGLIPTVAIIDEAELVPFEAFWALRMGAGKRPVSLTVLIGTPDRNLDNALYRWRCMVRDGVPGRYLEHAADPGCALDDEAQWAKANPAMRSGILRRDVIAAEAATAAVDPDAEVAFRIWRLGQWPDGDAPLDALGRALRSCEDPDASPAEPLVFAADIGPGDGDAWIVAVGDGVLEVVDRGPGTAWLPARLAGLVERHGGLVVVDRGGPIGARLEDIRRVVPTSELTAGEVMDAAARFQEDVLARVPRIRPSAPLRQAVAGAQRFGTSDRWRWARRRSRADVAPLVASSLAWWVAVNGAVPGIN